MAPPVRLWWDRGAGKRSLPGVSTGMSAAALSRPERLGVWVGRRWRIAAPGVRPPLRVTERPRYPCGVAPRRSADASECGLRSPRTPTALKPRVAALPSLEALPVVPVALVDARVLLTEVSSESSAYGSYSMNVSGSLVVSAVPAVLDSHQDTEVARLIIPGCICSCCNSARPCRGGGRSSASSSKASSPPSSIASVGCRMETAAATAAAEAP